jgi:hypothetical protein
VSGGKINKEGWSADVMKVFYNKVHNITLALKEQFGDRPIPTHWICQMTNEGTV